MNSVYVWKILCAILVCALAISNSCAVAESVPTESECRPHIEKALNTAKADTKEPDSAEILVDVEIDESNEDIQSFVENSYEEATANTSSDEDDDEKSKMSTENDGSNEVIDAEPNDGNSSDENHDSGENENIESQTDSEEKSDNDESIEVTDGHDNQSNEGGVNESAAASEEVSSENEVSTENKLDGSVDETTDNVGSSEEPDIEAEINPEVIKKDDRSEEAGEADVSEEYDKKGKNFDLSKGIHVPDADGDIDSNLNEIDSNESVQEEIATTAAVEESREVSAKTYPVEDLLLETEIPENLRDRSHIDEILRLNEDSIAQNEALEKIADNTLKELKRIYENAIKPLETLYKYRDLSNRHFGDPEIFSKPLVLFMGPWSGGKSSIINYLTDNEYTEHSLKTGAEPSHPYFNILMHGDSEQVLDGTQLAADWTFSGLQKFGQGLQDRLRGLKLPNKLLERVNIVEIPGILEVRKQVSRIFPFNDACQWFIDRADIIYLVYDPSKLDVGPETEAILDQLKGREYQTRIILNKADQVHPEELLRVQGALIWNISPLMSSQQPPIMYTVSLWSKPFEENSPVRLLQAQERALLQDLSQAIDHRIENKIASARRFAVRVRNHAKMVDCYLTTYYNHKTLFGNKKKISGEIVAHPQNYHIYEGLSTLTNISRYDLPDPEVYRDFFQLNPLYEFKKLSETCTYFRGCPINKLDVAIAYELPELVNRYKRAVGQALNTLELSSGGNDSTDGRGIKD